MHKNLPSGVLQERCFQKVCKTCRKVSAMEYYFQRCFRPVPSNLLKYDFIAAVFLQILQTLSEYQFCRISVNGFFSSHHKKTHKFTIASQVPIMNIGGQKKKPAKKLRLPKAGMQLRSA